MKFILFAAALVVLWWLLRGSLRSRQRPPPTPPEPTQPPRLQEMVACPQCGLHLPVSDALPGRGGLFCSDAHRSAFEHAHPAA